MCFVFKKKNNDSFSQKIFLPFDLLPLFYLLEWNQFKLFISEIISFQDKVVSLDYLKMEHIIKKYINYVKDNIKVKLNTKLTSSLMNITFFQNEKLFNLSYNWDFNRLPQYLSKSQYHKSGSEWIDFYDRSDDEDNGIPEKGWIFINFMECIHPRFYFDKKLGVMINDSYQYEPSYIRIRNYKNKYIESGEMKDILLRNLKKQCANL